MRRGKVIVGDVWRASVGSIRKRSEQSWKLSNHEVGSGATQFS
jgi:hypothetical protein